MQYDEAVTEARTLVKRSEEDQWRLAQLTWEQVEAGKSRAQWARDIGVHQSYAARLYMVWNRFADREDRPKFSEAWAEFDPTGGTRGADERGARKALADPDAVRQAIEDDPEIRKAAIEVVKQEQAKARDQLDDVASDRGWTDPETELAAQNLIDPGVPDEFKQQLLTGQADPVAFTEQGEPGFIPDTVERMAKEPSEWDGARQYSRWRRTTEDLLQYTPEEILLKKDREYIIGMTDDLPRFIEYLERLQKAARTRLTSVHVMGGAS